MVAIKGAWPNGNPYLPPPGRSALYRLFDAAGRLLYVGVTTNPAQRFSEHRRSKEWWPQVARRDVQWIPTREEAEQREIAAILAENPLHNKFIGKRRRP